MSEEYNTNGQSGRENPDETCRFWRHLYGGEHGFLHVFAGVRGEASERLTDTTSAHFPYPKAAGAAAEWAMQKSKEGREVYFCSHLLTKQRRIKENAEAVHTLWGDLDGAALPNGHLKPTAIVESSPGRFHCYWRLTDPIPPLAAEGLNKRLAAKIGADPSGFDLTQLLRVPGTINHKYPDRPIVQLRRLDGGRAYTPGELEKALPNEASERHGEAPADPEAAGDENEPPVRLGLGGLRVWRGERPKHKAGGEINRSATLFKIGAVLARAGASHRVIADALKERDRTLGWNKYSDRPDDSQYLAIAEKVVGDSRHEPPPEPTFSGATDPSFNTTDLGNAERLVAYHGDGIRYCHPWGKWLAYDGQRWAVDASGEVERRAIETVRGIYAEAEHEPDSTTRRNIAQHALRSESRSRIEAMMALARSRPGIPVQPEQLDAAPWLLNTLNGTIDLRTGELRPHRREDLITKLAPAEYDPDAQAPRFGRFLTEIFDEDEGVIGFVRRFAGYSLTGSTEERSFAILHGRGKNGKTTLVELLQDVMGDYATTTDTETILAKRYQGVGNDVAALKGARFVATAEVEQGRALAESKVKSLTGSDTVTARFLYGEPFSFKPEFKLWLSTNNKPVIRGTDDAIWDRVRLVPFDQRFEGAGADNRLPEKLRAEMPGVLAWMVEGCLEWQSAGLGEPERVRDATEGYREEMDVLAGFVDECCIVQPGVWCKFGDLYAAYTRWCEESNEHPEKKRRFASSLTERGFERDNGTDNVAIRRGIALRHDGETAPSRINDPPPKTGPESPYRHNSPSEPENLANSINERGEFADPQKTRKTEGSDERINDHYPRSNNLEPPPQVDESVRNTLIDDNSLIDRGGVAPKSTPRERRLTPEEAERIQRLIHEGMSPRYARAEVLGEEAGL